MAKYYKGRSDLVLVAFDPATFGDDLRWEPARKGDLFAHLYRSPLSLDTALALRVDDVDQGVDGEAGSTIRISYVSTMMGIRRSRAFESFE